MSRKSKKSSESSNNLVDYDGNVSLSEGINNTEPKMNSHTLLLIVVILLAELCERLTYYSVTANMLLFMQTRLNIEDANVSFSIMNTFFGLVYFIPVFGGYLSDVYLGKFNTIFLALLIYFVGLVSIDFSALPITNNSDSLFMLEIVGRQITFFLGLGLLAIGTGGIKSNVSPFGALQLQHLPERYTNSFFNWFYWFVNIGSIIAFLGVGALQTGYSFFIGYLIPTISLLVGLILFYIPKNRYQVDDIKVNAVKNFFLITISAFKNWRRLRKTNSDVSAKNLEYAAELYGGSFSDREVKDAQTILKVFPVFLCLIPFFIIYNQMSTSFILQSECLSLNVNSKGDVTIPLSWLQAIDSCIVILFTPIIDRLVYPLIRKSKIKITPLRRIGFGLALSITSMVSAGIVEIVRKQDMDRGNFFIQNIGGKTFNASTISVFIQIPQFSLVALSEIFVMINAMGFAFSEAPSSMKGVIMGLYLAVNGMSSFLSNLFLYIIKLATQNDPWLTDDINKGKLEYYLFFLGGMMLLNVGIFSFIAFRYKYKKESPIEVDS